MSAPSHRTDTEWEAAENRVLFERAERAKAVLLAMIDQPTAYALTEEALKAIRQALSHLEGER